MVVVAGTRSGDSFGQVDSCDAVIGVLAGTRWGALGPAYVSSLRKPPAVGDCAMHRAQQFLAYGSGLPFR